MPVDTKECPFCAETIKAAAKKCRYCGEWLEGHSRESTRRDIGFNQESQTVAGNQVNIGEGEIGHVGDQIEGDKISRDKIMAQGDVNIGKELRDEHHYIALNWVRQGRPLMRGFDLSERDLSSIELKGADLREANLYKTDLRGADLRQAYLWQADLREADLRNAYLGWFKPNLQSGGMFASKAQQRRQMMQGRRRSSRRPSGAFLVKADLSGANLSGADLEDANLSGANLRGAKLRDANLSGAKYTDGTKWPYGFYPEAHGAVMDNDDRPNSSQ